MSHTTCKDYSIYLSHHSHIHSTNLLGYSIEHSFKECTVWLFASLSLTFDSNHVVCSKVSGKSTFAVNHLLYLTDIIFAAEA